MPLIPFAAGLTAKLYLKYACSEVIVEGLPAFLEVLRGERGILTVANHISVVDEPMMWGILPLSTFLDTRTVRWTLGASDVMFTGKLDSWFFRSGQIIETFRGKGIYQDAIDLSAQKLDEGKWVHIFPEGRIKQEDVSELRRFKWGVSRILMEAEKTPLIIPIWIQGFEKAMSEQRTFPRFLPRAGHPIKITIGAPLNSTLEPLLATYRNTFPDPYRPATYIREVGDDLKDEPDELARMRSEMASVLRDGLMELGRGTRKLDKLEV